MEESSLLQRMGPVRPGDCSPYLMLNRPTIVTEHRGFRILLADDDEQVRRLCGTFLRMQGFEVLEAEDGDEAIQVAAEVDSNIDLLITDINMPGIDGIKLGQMFAAFWPDVKLLFCSGCPPPDFEARRPDGAGFLAKPFGLYALAEAVGGLLNFWFYPRQLGPIRVEDSHPVSRSSTPRPAA